MSSASRMMACSCLSAFYLHPRIGACANPDYDPNDLERYPPLAISDEEFRASVEAQMREIAAGTAVTYSHEQVMAGMRAKIAGKKHDE